ncbi:MAG: hypothetical protein VKQ33_10390 [Candidatus Sericytochromatia bacterium]|nr:hypothetical protein [Candidatus Sericytochromatia bacterium]
MPPSLTRTSAKLARALFGAIGLSPAVVVAVAVAPADAQPRPWVFRYEPSLESTTNLQQQAGGTPDLVLRNNLDASWMPLSGPDRSVLVRLSALSSRFQYNGDYDSTFLSGTGIGSLRFGGPVYGYAGYQVLYKQGVRPGTTNRLDGDAFGGIVSYWPLAEWLLVFHGYQADVLRAAVVETGYLGHSIYLSARLATTPAWTHGVSLRSQLRLYDAIGELEWRNQLTGETAYRFTDWFSLVLEGFVVNATASQPGLSFLGSNLGLFSRFTF